MGLAQLTGRGVLRGRCPMARTPGARPVPALHLVSPRRRLLHLHGEPGQNRHLPDARGKRGHNMITTIRLSATLRKVRTHGIVKDMKS